MLLMGISGVQVLCAKASLRRSGRMRSGDVAKRNISLQRIVG